MLSRFAYERDGLIGPAILRIGLATIMLGYYLLHIGTRDLIWGAHGQLDYASYLMATKGGALALFRYSPDPWFTNLLFFGSMLVSACYALGIVPRITCWLFAITSAATVDRNPLATDAGQTLVVLLGFLLCLVDSSRFSLVHFRFCEILAIRPFLTMLHNAGRFLITWQMAMIYFWAAFYKLGGTAWRDASAMYYVLNLQRFLAFPALSHLMASSPIIVASLTYGTLIFQIAFPFLIWNPQLKPYLVLTGIVLHAGIGLVLGLISFSLTMIVAELSLLPDEQFLRLAALSKRTTSILHVHKIWKRFGNIRETLDV